MSALRITSTLRWDHLLHLTGPLGLYEHALYDAPRTAHGYTTDDNARALVVLAWAAPDLDPGPYLRHVLDAFDGRQFRLRRRIDGRWVREMSDDATGRAVWGLGEWIGAGHGTPEIARVFEFHGAEHMSIHAFEAGEPLSVESVRRYPPEHPRCGTSFLLIVVLGSIILFSFFGRPGWLFLVTSRLLGIPIIAGVAYEILRWSGTRSSGWLARALAAPGIWLQKLTTRVPDEDQVEVAISSLVVALDDELVDDVIGRGGLPATALEVRSAVLGVAPPFGEE